MKFILQHLKSDKRGTLGFMEGVDVPFTCFILEPEIPIPAGMYFLELYNSPAHGKDTLQLIGVVGRSNIQIHVGNYLSDTKGCLLTGCDSATTSTHFHVLRSEAALLGLKNLIIPTLHNNEIVSLEIRSSKILSV